MTRCCRVRVRSKVFRCLHRPPRSATIHRGSFSVVLSSLYPHCDRLTGERRYWQPLGVQTSPPDGTSTGCPPGAFGAPGIGAEAGGDVVLTGGPPQAIVVIPSGADWRQSSPGATHARRPFACLGGRNQNRFSSGKGRALAVPLLPTLWRRVGEKIRHGSWWVVAVCGRLRSGVPVHGKPPGRKNPFRIVEGVTSWSASSLSVGII